MGKIDDLRRMREEEHARTEREAAELEKQAKRKPAPAPAPEPSAEVAAPTAIAPSSSQNGVAPPAIEVAPPKAKAKAAAEPPARTRVDPPARTRGGASGKDEVTGRCSSCGKVKTVNNGLVADHQKGLGKACPGSRKPPA